MYGKREGQRYRLWKKLAIIRVIFKMFLVVMPYPFFVAISDNINQVRLTTDLCLVIFFSFFVILGRPSLSLISSGMMASLWQLGNFNVGRQLSIRFSYFCMSYKQRH